MQHFGEKKISLPAVKWHRNTMQCRYLGACRLLKFCVELRTSFVMMAVMCCNINVVLNWLVEDAHNRAGLLFVIILYRIHVLTIITMLMMVMKAHCTAQYTHTLCC